LRLGARELGAFVELHFLDAPVEVPHGRIRTRNNESPAITRENLATWAEIFDRPTAEELELFDAPWAVTQT
jgi:predicted kinase